MLFNELPCVVLARFRQVIAEMLGPTPTADDHLYLAVALRFLAQEQDALAEADDDGLYELHPGASMKRKGRRTLEDGCVLTA